MNYKAFAANIKKLSLADIIALKNEYMSITGLNALEFGFDQSIILLQKEIDLRTKLLFQEKKTTNNQKTITERRSEFIKKSDILGKDYDVQMIIEFNDYWTEHGPRDKKMRFEKQSSFDISRRLKTWQKKANQIEQPQIQSGPVIKKWGRS